MFIEEARLAARIHHPNVCRIFELIEEAGLLALCMEWVDGGTLSEILETSNERGLLDRRVTAQIVAQVAGGLHAAHELRDDKGMLMQLVHRDVSPQNVLVARDGRVKVTDFGIAKALGRSHAATAIGTVKGKIAYMSPEQAQGKAVDRRSDIFSLGVILYLATVGTHPFRRPGESSKQQFARLLIDPITPPTNFAVDYPKELESILLRAMSRSPIDRFASAAEMQRQLEDWVERTGPTVTQQDIAEAVAGRIGASFREQAKDPASTVQLSRHGQPLDSKASSARHAVVAAMPTAPFEDGGTLVSERPTARPQRASLPLRR
jgi:serine/threonine-protein kinase